MPHKSRFPGQLPRLNFWRAGSGQTVGHQSLEGSLAQIFLDPYSEAVEECLVNFSCLFFSDRIRPDSGRSVPDQLPGKKIQDPNPHEDSERFNCSSLVYAQNLSPRKPQECGTSGNCMRMSGVPANPLWEIRIILPKPTSAGTRQKLSNPMNF